MKLTDTLKAGQEYNIKFIYKGEDFGVLNVKELTEDKKVVLFLLDIIMSIFDGVTDEGFAMIKSMFPLMEDIGKYGANMTDDQIKEIFAGFTIKTSKKPFIVENELA